MKPSRWCGNEHYYREWDTSRVGCDPDGSEESGARAACFDCSASRCGGAGATTTHWGCVASDPQFDAGNTDSNRNGVFGEKFYVKFPPKKQDDGATEVVMCPDPFTCDWVFPNGTANADQHGKCKLAYINPAREADKCAPWSEVYGFYTVGWAQVEPTV